MRSYFSLLTICGMIFIASCSTHRAMIRYNDYKKQIAIIPGSWDGSYLGKVSGEEGGFIWSNCTEKAKGSMRELIMKAKNMGANALGDIKWAASETAQPKCKRGWGYILLLPFIFTPLFMSTRVEATAYKVKRSKLKAHMYMLPEDEMEEEAFIEMILARQGL